VRGNDPSRLSPGTNAVSKSPSLWKTFLVFLAPLMLSNALQSLFGTVTNVLLGQMIGVD
jgi:Na+-driven multidrug efflux pump